MKILENKMEIKAWRIWVHFAGYFFCLIFGALIAAIPRFISGMDNESGVTVFISELLRVPITLSLLFFYTVYVSKIPLNKEILQASSMPSLKWLLLGLILPFAVLGIFYLTGNLEILDTDFNISQEIIIDNILKALGMSFAAGIIEELVFRGYMVNLLNKKYTFWFSAIFPSLLFTLVHIGGTDSLLNAVQLLFAGMLVSMMFLAIYKKTGSIWNACTVHFLWNFLNFNEMVDYGESNEPTHALIELNLGQNELFNGGAFGVEASIPALIVYGLTILLVLKLPPR